MGASRFFDRCMGEGARVSVGEAVLAFSAWGEGTEWSSGCHLSSFESKAAPCIELAALERERILMDW